MRPWLVGYLGLMSLYIIAKMISDNSYLLVIINKTFNIDILYFLSQKRRALEMKEYTSPLHPLGAPLVNKSLKRNERRRDCTFADLTTRGPPTVSFVASTTASVCLRRCRQLACSAPPQPAISLSPSTPLGCCPTKCSQYSQSIVCVCRSTGRANRPSGFHI